MKENRMIFTDSVRSLCIRQGWYNAGDNQAYSDMLDYVTGHNGTLEDIKWIAEDIYSHTTDSEWDGYDKKEILGNIAFHLVNDCCKTFIDF